MHFSKRYPWPQLFLQDVLSRLVPHIVDKVSRVYMQPIGRTHTIRILVFSACRYPPHARAYGFTQVRLPPRMPSAHTRKLIAMAICDARRAYMQQIKRGPYS